MRLLKLRVVILMLLLSVLVTQPGQALTLTDVAKQYVKNAAFFVNEDKLAEAVNCYDRAIAISPHVSLYMSKMSVLNKMEAYGEIIKCCDEALSLAPDAVSVYDMKFYGHFKMGSYDDALKCLNKILELNPKNANTFYNKACVYATLHSKDKAIQNLRKATELDESYKSYALSDPDLDNIKGSREFAILTGINVRINGTPLRLDVVPVVIEGRTLLPVRAVFETLGMRVEWDEASQTVTGTKDNTFIVIRIDQKEASVNGETKTLDVPAAIIDGTAMVPVRFISESSGALVDWIEKTESIYISTPGAASQPGEAEIENIFEMLDENVDIVFIHGSFSDPYKLKVTDGIALFVAENKEALVKFQSLDDGSKKKYLNSRIQDNWEELTGCEAAHARFIFKDYCYTLMDTSYKAVAEDLSIINFKNGMETNVVIQDRENDLYYYYYKKPLANTYYFVFNGTVPAKMKYLTTWETSKDSNNKVYFFIKDNDSLFRPVISVDAYTITAEEQNLKPDEFIESTKDVLSIVVTDLKMEEFVCVSQNSEFTKYEYAYTGQHGIYTYKCKGTTFIRGDLCVDIYMVSINYEFGKYEPIFDAMAGSFEFIKPAVQQQ